METDRIPLAVGVTGHRTIRPEDEPALIAGVKKALNELRQRYPHCPLVMVNDLAEGADQLCAKVALALGIPLVAVVTRQAHHLDDLLLRLLDGLW